MLCLAIFVPLVGRASPARACSCRRPSLEDALDRAYVAAEVMILEVSAPDPSTLDTGFDTQLLRVRLTRIFKAPPGYRDGDEVLIRHIGCNSQPYGSQSMGRRFIGYFASAEPYTLTRRFCSRWDDAWQALPYALVASRRLWLEQQRR